MAPYVRPYGAALAARLAEPRRFIQVVAGPRQVGKTTLVRQIVDAASVPSVYASGDEPTLRGGEWIAQQWERARVAALGSAEGAILVLDEVQKLPGWSEAVKRQWDADTRAGVALHVVLLGSAPLLVQRGLTESLTGRFELLTLRHWSLAEMRAAFGWGLDEYVFYGGYPGAAPLVAEPERWRQYIVHSLIETTVSRDVLLMSRIDKPALLRRLFELAVLHSGQIVSFTKMLGQLQDAGNATTLAHYLDLLAGAGMVAGLQKYAGASLRSRGSSPKLQVLNTALTSAMAGQGLAEARGDPERWGHQIESAVGAHLANAAMAGECELFYWRERGMEVDFVVRRRGRITAIEVKSGRAPAVLPGMAAFARAFEPDRQLLIGGDGIPVDEFLSRPVTDWVAG